MTQIELYDATLRDGMGGGGMSLTAAEKVRLVHRLDDLGIDIIEAGFPASNPKEAELFALLERELLAPRDDRRLRHDPPAWRGRRRGRRAARAGRLLRDDLHDRRQDVDQPRREGRPRLARGEPRDDRRVRRVPRGERQARHLRRRARLRRAARGPRLRARRACAPRPTPAPSASSCATRTGPRCPATSRARSPRSGVPCPASRSASTATTTAAARSPTRSWPSRPARPRCRAR